MGLTKEEKLARKKEKVLQKKIAALEKQKQTFRVIFLIFLTITSVFDLKN